MEVILLQDIQNLGRRGAVVKVKPGYGRNFLLPQGFALHATPGNMKYFEQQRVKIDAQVAVEREAAMAVAAQVTNTRISVQRRVTEDGETLYGSVTATDVGDELESQGIEVDRRKIDIQGGIKTIGDHTVAIHLHSDVVAELTVTVTPQED